MSAAIRGVSVVYVTEGFQGAEFSRFCVALCSLQRAPAHALLGIYVHTFKYTTLSQLFGALPGGYCPASGARDRTRRQKAASHPPPGRCSQAAVCCLYYIRYALLSPSRHETKSSLCALFFFPVPIPEVTSLEGRGCLCRGADHTQVWPGGAGDCTIQ